MVAIGFYFISLIMYFTVYFLLRNTDQRKTYFGKFTIGFAVWLVYLFAISGFGALDSLEMPPRIPLLVVIPVLAFILWVTSKSPIKQLIPGISPSFVVYVQVFRVGVELLIFGAYLNGIFPKVVTFEGMNYDILVGISAPIIGFLVQRNKLGKKGLLTWNVISLMVLSVTVYSFISSYYFSGDQSVTEAGQFVRMPYLLLASVLMPFAVFYHVVSIKQQLKKA